MAPHPIPVLLEKADGYHKEAVKNFIDTGREHIFPKRTFRGTKVLLKPNLISGRAQSISCTDGRFIAAVAEWFIDNGAQVSVGDSPAFGSLDHVLNRHGIHSELSHLDIRRQPFKTVRTISISHGVNIGVAEEALCCDLFVNLPKVKAHSQMYLTLAVKNLFGIVCGMRKAVAHMKNGSSHARFADLMLDLVELLPEHVSIADGIVAMHRDGPVSGDPLNLGCLAMSRNPIALDTAIVHALELDPDRCPILQAAKVRGLAGSVIQEIDFQKHTPEDFWGSGFMAPEELSPVVFNPFRFVSSLTKRVLLRFSN